MRGIVHVTSYADPPKGIANHGPLSDEAGRYFALRWRGEGLAELAEIVDGREAKIADRTAAARLTNKQLYVARAQLPPPQEDEFYLADLVGLSAFDAAGVRLGCVAAVHDYGAGTSLEIEAADGPLVVPFTQAAVPVVDVAAGRVVVEVPVSVPLPLSPSPEGRGDSQNSSPLPLGEGDRGRGEHEAPPS